MLGKAAGCCWQQSHITEPCLRWPGELREPVTALWHYSDSWVDWVETFGNQNSAQPSLATNDVEKNGVCAREHKNKDNKLFGCLFWVAGFIFWVNTLLSSLCEYLEWRWFWGCSLWLPPTVRSRRPWSQDWFENKLCNPRGTYPPWIKHFRGYL